MSLFSICSSSCSSSSFLVFDSLQSSQQCKACLLLLRQCLCHNEALPGMIEEVEEEFQVVLCLALLHLLLLCLQCVQEQFHIAQGQCLLVRLDGVLQLLHQRSLSCVLCLGCLGHNLQPPPLPLRLQTSCSPPQCKTRTLLSRKFGKTLSGVRYSEQQGQTLLLCRWVEMQV